MESSGQRLISSIGKKKWHFFSLEKKKSKFSDLFKISDFVRFFSQDMAGLESSGQIAFFRVMDLFFADKIVFFKKVGIFGKKSDFLRFFEILDFFDIF